MKTSTTSGARKGITPVVAIVLLLMLTIVAVGGMWAWTSDILKQEQDEASDALNTGMEFRSLSCTDGGTSDSLSWLIRNTGQQDINLQEYDLYVEDANGDIIYQESPTNGKVLTSTDRHWDVGATSGSPHSIGDVITSGSYYTVVIETTDSSVTASQRCQAS